MSAFGKPILLQFASNLCNLFLNVLQLAHDHRERGLCFRMLQVGMSAIRCFSLRAMPSTASASAGSMACTCF